MSDINKIILIVLDSLGVGELPDADKYNDVGSNTLKHIFESMDNDYILENLGRLGLYNIVSSPHVKYNPNDIIGNYGKMATLSPAKDTTAGHWELAGLVLDKPFPTYPNGFPKEIIDEFEKKIGCKIVGNCTASGTEIIQRLGDEHLRTGYPIVYTSADSVFQIAAHEQPGKFGGLKRLHEICQIARDMLVGEHSVGRVIARPFITENSKYIRTPNRRDYSLSPVGKTILNKIVNVGGNVTAIGKITDIFNEQGISVSYHSKGNSSGIQYTIKSIAEPKVYVKAGPTTILGNDTDLSRKHLIFTNLIDFDMLWGHRRDVNAYAQGLKFFDRQLPNIMDVMSENDLLIITADHGCDPTYTKHTDHTREYVPLLVYGKSLKQNVNLGTRKTLADVAQTIADIFELTPMKNGTSFKDDIL